MRHTLSASTTGFTRWLTPVELAVLIHRWFTGLFIQFTAFVNCAVNGGVQ